MPQLNKTKKENKEPESGKDKRGMRVTMTETE